MHGQSGKRLQKTHDAAKPKESMSDKKTLAKDAKDESKCAYYTFCLLHTVYLTPPPICQKTIYCASYLFSTKNTDDKRKKGSKKSCEPREYV